MDDSEMGEHDDTDEHGGDEKVAFGNPPWRRGPSCGGDERGRVLRADSVSVRPCDTVTFFVTNSGDIDHEFVVGS